MCGIKNFASVRLYSAPQSHWTIVSIIQICASGRPVQAAIPCFHRAITGRRPMKEPPTPEPVLRQHIALTAEVIEMIECAGMNVN